MRYVTSILISIVLLFRLVCFDAFIIQHSTNIRHIRTQLDASKRSKIAVIGAGWAGYSFAESISENEADVIILDAAKASGGLAGGWRTAGGRPVEAGIHGFWREYKNTFDMMENKIGLDLNSVLGDYSPSALYSKNGKVAVAPVLASDDDASHSKSLTCLSWDVSHLTEVIASNLPPPLDVALLAEFHPNSKLSMIDRFSAIGLLGAWADFEQESSVSWKRYDNIPADTLFKNAGVTDELYEELISPLLHVLPMCPAYDCSAAAALSCFHVFALQSRGAFDVRWAKGNLSELIFQPWQDHLQSRGVKIQQGSKVSCIQKNELRYDSDYRFTISLEGGSSLECDAIVFAVGAVSMGKIAQISPALSSINNFMNWRGITCVAVRLFLKPHDITTTGLKGGNFDSTNAFPEIANAMISSPIAVCGPDIGKGRFPQLKETGFCIYDLQRMHQEFSVKQCKDVSVIEIDFYRANEIAEMDDESIAAFSLEVLTTALQINPISNENIVDSAIVRARDAVSHFSPGSASYSPSCKLDDGLYICGDWVDRSGHASWSTEKSVVTAKQAAIALSRDFGWTPNISIIPAAEDTLQLSTLRGVARMIRFTAPSIGLPKAPWVVAKEKLGQCCHEPKKNEVS